MKLAHLIFQEKTFFLDVFCNQTKLVLLIVSLCCLSIDLGGQVKIDIEGPGDQILRIKSTDTERSIIDLFRVPGPGVRTNWRILNDLTGDLQILYNTNDEYVTPGNILMRMSEFGNVGIGAFPLAKLHLGNGNAATLTEHGHFMIGTTTGRNLIFDTDEIFARNNGAPGNLILQEDGGNVGIGITVPSQPLEVNGDVTIGGGADNHDGDTEYMVIHGEKDSWALGVENQGGFLPTDFFIGKSTTPDQIFHLESDGDLGIGTQPWARLHIEGPNDVSLTTHGELLIGDQDGLNIAMDRNEIMARNAESGSGLFIQHEGGDVMLCGEEKGQVGIGILDPANLPDSTYLLAVDGKVLCEEVLVEISTSWPDYVFEKTYPLLSLTDLEQQIKQTGHLPNIPSSEEIENTGISLGDMQVRMMEKIEELTLYVIQLHHRNLQLERKIKTLQEQRDTHE